MLGVIGLSFCYSVVATTSERERQARENRRHAHRPHADHTPEALRERASKHTYRDGRPSGTVADIRERIRDGFRPVSPRPVHPRADPAAPEVSGGISARWRRLATAGGGGPSRRRGRRGRSRGRSGRGPDRPEGHAVAGLGAEGNAPAHRAGPPLRICLPVLRGRPGDRDRGRACLRAGQHGRDEPPSPGDRGAGPRQCLPAPAAALQCPPVRNGTPWRRWPRS